MAEGNAVNTCPHDWRTDPFTTLTSNPPQSRDVCCLCGAIRTYSITPAGLLPDPNDPTTWPRSAHD